MNEEKFFYRKCALHYKSGNVYVRNYNAACCQLHGNAESIDKIGKQNTDTLMKSFEDWCINDKQVFETGLEYLVRITNEGDYTAEEIDNALWSDMPDYIEN